MNLGHDGISKQDGDLCTPVGVALSKILLQVHAHSLNYAIAQTYIKNSPFGVFLKEKRTNGVYE